MISYRPKDPRRVRLLRPLALRLCPTLPCNFFLTELYIKPGLVHWFIRWVAPRFDRPDEYKTQDESSPVSQQLPATPSLSRKLLSSLPFYSTPSNESTYPPSVLAFSVDPPAIRNPAEFCRSKIIDRNIISFTSCAIHPTDSLD